MHLLQSIVQPPALAARYATVATSARRRFAPLALLGTLAACSGAPESWSAAEDEGAAESALITSGPSASVTVTKGTVTGGSSATEEHCAAPQSTLDTLGIQLGWQMRVQASTTNYTICTVTQVTTDGTVRMTAAGMTDRLGLSASVSSFAATLYRSVPNPTAALKNDYVTQQSQGELVEQRIDDGSSRLISIAPHGGKIDATNTHLQAERVRTYLAGIATPIPTVTWTATGWKNPGNLNTVSTHDIWHITSTEINENSFTELGAVIGRGFDYAVSFHAIGDSTAQAGGSCPTPLPAGTQCLVVWVGGGAVGTPGNDAIKSAIITRITTDLIAAGLPAASFTVSLTPAGGGNGGTANANIVNRLARDRWGVQLEQTPNMLKTYSTQIADAVAKVYALQPDR